MMKTTWLTVWICALLIAAGAVPVQAAQTKSGADVAHISGGTGDASHESLKAREKEFNLKLVFTLVEGNYIADVNVAVKDAAGKSVLEATADGPIFMARLPAGLYTVGATYDGVAQTRKVKVSDRLRTEYLRWPSKPGIDDPVREEGGRGTATAAAPVTEVIADGVGETALAQLKAIESQYNLKLVFTLVEGNYVANVNVAIKDAHGKPIIERLAGGPIFLARLPAGAYSVVATYDGKSETRQIKVGQRLRTDYFRWPGKPGVDLSLPPESRRGAENK